MYKATITPLFLSTLLALAGCGDSSHSGSSQSSAPASITGIVLQDETPITKAKIEAMDAAGKVIANTEVGGDGHYRISIPVGAKYPVVLSARFEGEGSPLKAAITSDLATDQNISSVTTIVVNTAMNLGGLTETNLAKAAGAAISQRKSTGGSGGSAGFKGDPTKHYGGWH
jgi:hypothetical protein